MNSEERQKLDHAYRKTYMAEDTLYDLEKKVEALYRALGYVHSKHMYVAAKIETGEKKAGK